MDKDKYDTILIRGSEGKDEGSMDFLSEEKGVATITIPEMQREIHIWRDLKAFIKLYKILRVEKPDIVHTHLSKAGFLGRAAAIIVGGGKIVHTFHGHTLHGYWGRFKTSFFKNLERILAKHSTCLIAVSDKVRRDLIKAGVTDKDKIITIHLGLELERFINLEKYRGLLRREFSIDDDTVLVGIIARLVPIKNHTLFIEAVARMKTKNPSAYKSAKFPIIGDGELRKELEDLVKAKGISDKIVFTGFRNDLEKIYADLDISVLSSLNEGLPVAVIESMTAGVPVVSTDVGGVRELIDDGINGFVVPSQNAEVLADRISELIENRSLREGYSFKAKEKVYPYFDYRRLVSDMEELYDCLISGKSFHYLSMKGYKERFVGKEV